MRLSKRFALAFLLGTLAGARVAYAQEMELPVANHVPLLLKVITFDRQFSPADHPEIVLGIAYQSGNRASIAAKDEAIRTVGRLGGDFVGRPIRAVAIDLDRENLVQALTTPHMCALYVTPVRGYDVTNIAAAARRSQVRTLTGVPRYVANGLAVGVRLIGERPKLVVNLAASRLEGADFSAELLKLAQVTP